MNVRVGTGIRNGTGDAAMGADDRSLPVGTARAYEKRRGASVKAKADALKKIRRAT